MGAVGVVSVTSPRGRSCLSPYGGRHAELAGSPINIAVCLPLVQANEAELQLVLTDLYEAGWSFEVTVPYGNTLVSDV